jgi:hypothetical protein
MLSVGYIVHVRVQINGRPLVAAEGTERLAAAAATADGRFLLTGGAKGSVRLRWLHSLQVACYPCFDQQIGEGYTKGAAMHLGAVQRKYIGFCPC